MVFNTVVGPLARIVGMPEWHIGVMVSAAGLCWMLASRPWGRYADRQGHWQGLRLGMKWLFGGFLALALVSIAGYERLIGPTTLFVLLLLIRCFLGSIYAVVPIGAQSMIATHFEPKDRPAAMAALGASSALGMILGPAIGGVLGAISFWYPMIATAILATVALLISQRSSLNQSQLAPVESTGSASGLPLSDSRLHWAMVVAFGAMFCVMSAQVNTAFFLMDRLHIPIGQATAKTGLALTFVGLAILSTQLLVRFLSQRGIKLTPNQMIVIGSGVGALGFGLTTLVTTIDLICLTYFIAGFGMGFLFPSFTALASISVEQHEVASAAGNVSAAQASGMVIGPFVGSLIYRLDPRAPYWLIFIVLLGIFLWACRSYAKQLITRSA